MTWISVDRSSSTPLFRQVYNEFRNRILQGELHSGEQLPSTRQLSASLQISRNVIVEAYEQLLAEGYIEGRHGSGTYVAEGIFMQHTRAEPSLLFDPPVQSADVHNDLIDFRHGIPALDLFPRKLWGELVKQVCIEVPDEHFGYGKPEGCSPFRIILARYLSKTRGVVCDPDQLIVTTGATQALSLVAKLLLSNPSDVIIEDPITKEIHTMFAIPGTTLHPVPVDWHGMKTELLPTDIKPRFVYVTPSHQFPLGGVLPIQRRVQLIHYAVKNDSYIVEDDYDSEFRYEGAPVSSLQGLDPNRVIYIGTFSKILSPALRLGYLILPRSLIKKGRNLKWLTDLHTPSLEQLTLARFIEMGHLERHISKMKKIYRKRRDFLIKCLTEKFGDKITIIGDSTGIHLVVEFAEVHFTSSLLARLEWNGVKVYPVDIHAIHKERHQQQIILGFGNVTEDRIEEGIQRLLNTLT